MSGIFSEFPLPFFQELEPEAAGADEEVQEEAEACCPSWISWFNLWVCVVVSGMVFGLPLALLLLPHTAHPLNVSGQDDNGSSPTPTTAAIVRVVRGDHYESLFLLTSKTRRRKFDAKTKCLIRRSQ